MIADIPGFACNTCGKCCKKYTGNLSATVGDMKRWADQSRNDILDRTLPLVDELSIWLAPSSRDDQLIADLWFTPKGNEHNACPWWNKHTGCRIHETKPKMCADYPVSLQQALDDECEGLP